MSKGIPLINAYAQKNKLWAFHRDDNGNLKRRNLVAEYSAFIKASHKDAPILRDKNISRIVEEGDHLRLVFKDNDARKMMAYTGGVLGHYGIETFEADVNPVRRWLTDNTINLQKPKRCYYDLETDSSSTILDAIEGRAKILSWSISDDNGLVASAVLEADEYEAERVLVQNCFEILKEFDQVCGWNSYYFDDEVLRNRIQYLNFRQDFRRWLWVDHMEIFKRLNTGAAEDAEQKTSFSLEAIAQALLGEGKHDFNSSQTWQAWLDPVMRETLLRYNEQDALLMPKIEKKTGYLDLFFTICQICNVLPDNRGSKPVNFGEGVLMKMGAKRGIRFPNKPPVNDTEQFAGALVTEPRVGIHKDVHVLDFASLYPSVIATFNISPETHDPAGECIVPITNEHFRNDVLGVLAQACIEFMQNRNYWKKEKAKAPPGSEKWYDAHRMTSGYKTTQNSLYGLIGCPWSRFFKREVAESVSQGARWLLEQTQQHIVDIGYQNQYSDTDAVMLTGCTKLQCEELVRECNEEFYPQILWTCGAPSNYIVLDYAQEFSKIIFLAKKCYAARIKHAKGIEPEGYATEIKGLAIKRGDSARLARQMQQESLELILRDDVEDYEVLNDFVLRWKDKILKRELNPEDFVITKKISRDLNDYKTRLKKDGTPTKLPAHVRIAKKMVAEGGSVPIGTRISYVIVDGSDGIEAIPFSEFQDEFDRAYLWERIVFPHTQRVLLAAYPCPYWVRALKARHKKPWHKDQLNLFGSA